MLKFEQCKGWWVDVFKNILIYYATFKFFWNIFNEYWVPKRFLNNILKNYWKTFKLTLKWLNNEIFMGIFTSTPLYKIYCNVFLGKRKNFDIDL